METLLSTDIPGLPLVARGKVRDIYGLDDRLLIIATDRISAFDCILPNGIPGKGRILTAMSRFWFELMSDIVPNHLEDPTPVGPLPPELERQWPELSERSMLVKRASPFPIECVARGYLAGSAWKEYHENSHAGIRKDGLIPCAGVLLPSGLAESAKLPEPVFTPATKAASGHDENISFEQAAALVGKETASRLRTTTLEIYARASAYAAERGIIVADTKFEYGVADGRFLLIDEALTPDSSRFWDAEQYRPGRPQPSFDKQFVRDYLAGLDWNKTPPAPPLPPEIVEMTADKYREAYRRLVGREVTS